MQTFAPKLILKENRNKLPRPKTPVTKCFLFPLDPWALSYAENKGDGLISTYFSTSLWKAAPDLKCHFMLFVYNVLHGQV